MKKLRERLALPVTALALGCVALTGCAGSPSAARQNDAAQPETIPSSQVVSVALTEGSLRPSMIVADNTDGVWCWTVSDGRTVLLHVSDAGQKDEYDLGNAVTDGLATGLVTPIAVAPNGTVWLGAGGTVASFDPATVTTQFWHLPAALLASSLTTSTGVTSIAATRDGTIAVAIDGVTKIAELHPTTGLFSALALPDGQGAPSSLVALDDGTLAVGFGDSTGAGIAGSTLLVASSGTAISAKVSGLNLSGDGTSVLVADGNLSKVAPDESVTRLAAGEKGSDDKNSVDFNQPGAPGSGSSIVASTNSGLEILDAQGTVEATLTVPPFACSGKSGVNQSSELPGASCPQIARSLSADKQGSLFFAATGPASALYELPAAALSGSLR